MSRQSNRNKPKTKFSNGIRQGKLMAKEYTGVLLCMLLVVRSTKGRKMLGKRKQKFGPDALHDWQMVIETLLQWEVWMKKDKLMKKHVRAARQKHRYIMYLIKKVASRKKGMGLKITKFHAILHIADDILNFGVPMEVDTGSNETGHKPTKTAAKLTQKQRKTFEIQTATRLEEVHLLELAKQEGMGRPLWDYYHGYLHDEPMVEKEQPKPYLGGSMYRCWEDDDGEHQITPLGTRGKGKGPQFSMETSLIEFVAGLGEAVSAHIDDVVMHTTHKRNGQIFRGDACYKGSVWRDWVLVDWDDDGHLPNKIWGFVDLTDLPHNSGIDYGGLLSLMPGMYGIVESAVVLDGEDYHSELVLDIETETIKDAGGNVVDLVLYLADVEAFLEPIMVVPNIGERSCQNRYLWIKSREQWGETFEEWLEEPHELDNITIQEPLDDEDELESDDSDEEVNEEDEEDIEEEEDDTDDEDEESSDENEDSDQESDDQN